jgi:hypothetical protein
MVFHCAPETLTLLALGESEGLDDDRTHIAECSECAKEVAAFAELVDVARTVTPADQLQQPPAEVWEAIDREVRAGMPVDELAARRQRRSTAPWIAVAAVSGLVIGGLGVTAITNIGNTAPDTTLIAQAELLPLPGNEVAGIAQVEQRDAGAILSVEVPNLPSRDGYYEVWLLKPDVSNMVSIGVLPENGAAAFPLPASLDLNEFSVVDISREAYDGDATHSTDSVVRGSL